MSQTFTGLYIHYVFSTKNRRMIISPEVQRGLYEYIGGIVQKKGGVLIKAGGWGNHIHLLISQPKNVAVSELIREVKSSSSKWVHETFSFQRRFAWQTGYGAFSVSKSNLESVKAYIEGQIEHHRTKTFKEEVLAFLKKHDLPYNERYMWE